MHVWTFVGTVSVLWSLIELSTGQAWLHREIDRDREPLFYWVTVLFWFALGAWCLLPLYW